MKSLVSRSRELTKTLTKCHNNEVLNGLPCPLVAEIKPSPYKNTTYCEEQCEQDIFLHFHEMHTSQNAVEWACQHSLIYQAHALLRKNSIPMKEIRLACNCGTPILIPVPVETCSN